MSDKQNQTFREIFNIVSRKDCVINGLELSDEVYSGLQKINTPENDASS